MLLPRQLEGIGYFCKEAFSRITASHPEHEFFFIFDRPFDPSYVSSPNVTGIYAGLPARHPLLWYLWYEKTLPRIFRKLNPDVFVSPDGYMSLSADIPTLTVIHDINFEHYPKDLPFSTRAYYRHFFPKYALRSTRIATVSEFSRKDIARQYTVPESKIDVVYNGVNEGFHPVASSIAGATRQRWTDGNPFFLFIGAIHRRKNIVNLLKAFERFREENDTSMKLVFAGIKRWWTPEMEEALQAMSHRSEVIFTGRLEEVDLHALTAAAFAVTYVSNFEGFGIPILEGMRSGVPVITSNVTSMPEVAGDAALLADPFDIDSISDAMTRIYKDAALRQRLAIAGLERSARFSWDATAESLWKSILRTLETKD
jgi:glycosyltransferase involved in cell wall biosynthesis